MKNFIHGVLVVSALASVLSLTAQNTQTVPSAQTPPASPAAIPATTMTADEIVNKHVAALGGKDVISQVKSVSMESAFTMMGSDNPSTTTILDGVGFKNETELNGAKIVRCITDKGGWTINPMTGAAGATPMPDDDYKTGKDQIYVADALYDYAARGSKIELLGKDGAAFKIKLTSKENVESIYLIDPTSFLITSVSTKGKIQDSEIQITSKLSDYRKTDLGMQMPYAIDVDLGGQFQIAIAVKKVELNKTIDPAIFTMPK